MRAWWCVTVLVALVLLAAPPPAVAQSGPVAAYGFSEGSGTTVADASGNGNTGVLTSGPVFVAGKNGTGLGFDGVNDFVNLSNPVSLRLTGSMTLSAWIKSGGPATGDRAIVSKRQSSGVGYELDTTLDTGARTIGFRIANGPGNLASRYGATALQLDTWYHVAGVYNAASRTMTVYLNGQVDNGTLAGTVPTAQTSASQNVNLGRRPSAPGAFNFAGVLDDVRIYDRALSQAEIQLDMATPVGGADTTPPSVAITAPAASAVVTGTSVTVSATASDDRGVMGVQFLLDGTNLGAEDTVPPYSVVWNTTTGASGPRTLTARARDTGGNTTTSAPIAVVVDNVPPAGTVVINAGAAATNSRAATLTLAASDTASVVTQMRFSNTGTSYSAAQAYATSAPWTLSSGAGTKTVYAQFRDGAGNWSAAVTDTIVLDTTAPAISGTTAGAITATSATVTWTTSEASTSQVNYGLTTSYGQTTPLDGALVTSHSVVLTGLAAQTTYNYRVRSRDAAGNEAVSGNFTFTTVAGADVTPPSAPTGLVATPASATRIDLVWNASTDNVGVAGYRVSRGGTLVATITATAYADTGLTPATPYQYTVAAFDAAGNVSAPSAPAGATTPPSDTTAPLISLTAPAAGATVSGVVVVSATATDGVGVVGVQFLLDGAPLGAEDTGIPYSISWNSATAANGAHTLSARARDAAGNVGTAAPISVTVSNSAASDLAAGWNFNEGAGSIAQDVSGNHNTASVPTASVWTTGHSGAGVDLAGTRFLSVPDSPSLDVSGNALTVSFWIHPRTPTGGDTVVIGKFWNASMTAPFYQYGLELGGGVIPRFFVGTVAALESAAMPGTLAVNQWSHLAVVFDGAQVQFYLNGVALPPQPLAATLVARGQGLRIGADADGGQILDAVLDDVRIYARVLAQAEVQADMTTPLGGTPGSDSTPPSVALTFPLAGAQLSDIITVTADADDNVGVAGVRFLVDGVPVGVEDTQAPYGLSWDTRTVANGVRTLTASARDAAGNVTVSSPVTVNVANTNFFQNEILATGFNMPTSIAFLPDGRLLVLELPGVLKVVPPPYTQPSPTPFLTLTNVGTASSVQQGAYTVAVDPGFASNRFFYVFYTAGTPNRDRLSRFTANASLTGTVPGSEVVLYQDPLDAHSEHHGGAIMFGNDGKLYFTTGENFSALESQSLDSPRGKIHRINNDGTVPTDNPFHDGPGPNWDSVWALGLRNPFRASYDAPTGRMFVGDVGSNDNSFSKEELNLGVAGANYGWPFFEGPCSPPCTGPIYWYHHSGRDASITGGFVYRGTQFPSSYQGSYFFADYTQNWIRRLTLDAAGNVTGVFNFEPADGSVDGPYGDIVQLVEGPDGALYYVDLAYSDVGGEFGLSKIRRIRHLQSNQAPVAVASANVTKGPAPLTVAFSSAGSLDPEGQPLGYSWTFGDTGTSTLPDPTHVYTQSGQYTARLAVSDGVNTTQATPIAIAVGNAPSASILSPANDLRFRAGDVIAFSGTATDTEDGTLPASAFSWSIDFLHEGHAHPGVPITGTTSGSFTIPSAGHDFSGNTRYRITLTVTDSSGLSSQQSVVVIPDKVSLTFATVPAGLTIYLDGIARTAPLVHDTLIGFVHTIEAPAQTVNGTAYTFASWSDGGAALHPITVPAVGQSYTATYTAGAPPLPAGLMAAWSFGAGSGTTVGDASGHGNTATLVNGVTWTAGRYGGGLAFDGVNGHLQVPDSPSLDIAGSELTLTMWIAPEALAGGDSVVLGKFWNPSMSWPYYQYGIELSAGRHPVFFVGSPADYQAVWMGAELPLGQWSHLAIVFNGSQALFYLNGGLVSAPSLAATLQARGNALKIGADATPGQFYRGFLDEVRIYARALTPAEVQTDMNTPMSGGF